MKHLNIVFLLIMMLSVAGCDPHDGKLTLVNNSNDTIYYDVAYCRDSIISYPLVQKNGKDDYLFSNILEPQSEQHIPVMDTWEYFINERCEDSTLRVFFFSENLIKTASKDSVMKYQLYSQKLKLKVTDLEKLNWKVVYDEKK